MAETWVGIIVAILIGLAGIFEAKNWIFKPKLCISIDLTPPDCHMVPLTRKGTDEVIDNVYYLRFRIDNNDGIREARDVQVMATELYKFSDREYKKVDSFLPLNLVWSHMHEMAMENRMTMKTIPAGVFRHCDLGYLTHNSWKDQLLNLYHLGKQANVILKMDTIVEPNTGSHIVFPGKYRLTVHISASNAKPLRKVFQIEIKDIWSELGENMVDIKET